VKPISGQGRKNRKKGARLRVVALFFIFSALGCSLMKERPIQLMSDTSAALRAAKEVSADTLAPELYRRATDAYFRAQNEYRLKNFAIAEDFANRAKRLAEEAEFEALKQGSNRTSLLPPEEPVAPPPPSEIGPPRGELATEAMKRQDSGGSVGGASGPAGMTGAPAPSGNAASSPPTNFAP
jgi:hypothetical protein